MDYTSTASSSTFVDLTTDQNIAGNKIFEKDVVINALLLEEENLTKTQIQLLDWVP
jgi:hypothetical protein